MEDIQVKLGKAHEQTQFSTGEIERLKAYIGELEELREAGEACREELQSEVVRLCALSMPLFDGEVVGRVSKSMSVGELKTVKSALLQKLENRLPTTPQLAVADTKGAPAGNIEFLI